MTAINERDIIVDISTIDLLAMSQEDVLLLCEYVLETHLGEDILHPVGRVLIRSGPQTLQNLVDKTHASP